MSATTIPQIDSRYVSHRRVGKYVIILYFNLEIILENMSVDIWELIDGVRSTYDISAILASKYNVPIDQIEKTVIDFVLKFFQTRVLIDISKVVKESSS